MKLKFLAISLLATFAAHAAVNIDRVEPTNWYAGMKNPSLQLMVYGKGIKQANVSTDYAGVKVDSVVRLDSPDYDPTQDPNYNPDDSSDDNRYTGDPSAMPFWN